jgi:putative transposase
MAIRLVITDAVWAELEPVLRTMQHDAGSPPQLSDRLFIEAVLYQARTGIPWRD